jgi:hypothetical protein
MSRDMTVRGAGIGLRAPHVAEAIERRPQLGWIEVHAENYMLAGPFAADLETIRRDAPLSIHGVGLSLAGADPLDPAHLARLKTVCERFAPALVSEHLAWCMQAGAFLNDLLPIPYTEEALAWVAGRITQTQEALGRAILIENPSRYYDFADSAIPEAEFLAALAARTGCGLLFDVNNLYVSACNLDFDIAAYLDALPADAIGELHLAGHALESLDGVAIRIDTHGEAVASEVWSLYREVVTRFGPKPTLIEWDSNLPSLDALLAEAQTAGRILAATRHDRAA